MFGLSAALYGEMTIKDGRVEQTNFGDYRVLRINEVPQIDVHIVKSLEAPGGHRRARHVVRDAGADQCDLRGQRQAHSQAAGRGADAHGVKGSERPRGRVRRVTQQATSLHITVDPMTDAYLRWTR